MTPKEKFSTIEALAQMDVIDKIKPALQRKLIYIDLEDGMIRAYEKGMAYVSADKDRPYPWLFHWNGKRTGRRCTLWQEIMFKTFGLLPSFCRYKCYKVVAVPRDFRELLLWSEAQKVCGMPGKLGAEHRPYVPRQWGSYFYANGKKQGEEFYDRACKMRDENGFDGMKIILKRACTEMEMKHGSPHEWPEMTDYERKQERRLDSLFDLPDGEHEQPDFLRQWIVQGWISHAWANGDMTVCDYNGGELLVSPPVDYALGRRIEQKEVDHGRQ